MEERRFHGNSILRAVFVGVSLLMQVGWVLLRVMWLNEHFPWIAFLTDLLSIFIVLRLYSRHTTAAMKMPWIILILAFPVMGLTLFLLIEGFGDLGRTGKHLRDARAAAWKDICQEEQVPEDRADANLSGYLWNHTGSPVYGNTAVRYYGQADQAFEALKKDLEGAEKYIFMEYFIVRDGSAFRELQEILVRKAREGVEVRFLYDDIGSIGYVNLKFAKMLNESGIRCHAFNPALPVLNLFMNHRDHRKITVIDGKVGYTGGFNLADEYFGREFPYGKWKDTGIRMEGDAVRSLTAMFLEMWNTAEPESGDDSAYLSVKHTVAAEGFVQPFGDNPMESERAAENVYLNLIGSARESLYIITPYLIITDEMSRALGLAAKRGVDVRIITPGIPDKKTVYSVTRSYYAGLVTQGVRIFEWSPGFCHAKACIADGRTASIGTSNLDYRSLYLHFENDVVLYGGEAVHAMAADFEETFAQCREVTEYYRSGRGAMLRTWQCLLRLFAPLM